MKNGNTDNINMKTIKLLSDHICDRVTELGNTHAQSCVATAGVHAQRCPEICNGGRSTAAVAAYSYPHSNHTRRGGGGGARGRSRISPEQGGRQEQRGRRHAMRQPTAADD